MLKDFGGHRTLVMPPFLKYLRDSIWTVPGNMRGAVSI